MFSNRSSYKGKVFDSMYSQLKIRLALNYVCMCPNDFWSDCNVPYRWTVIFHMINFTFDLIKSDNVEIFATLQEGNIPAGCIVYQPC